MAKPKNNAKILDMERYNELEGAVTSALYNKQQMGKHKMAKVKYPKCWASRGLGNSKWSLTLYSTKDNEKCGNLNKRRLK